MLVTPRTFAGASDIEMPPLRAARDDAKGQQPARAHNDVTVVPYAGGDSDIGFGGGAMFSVARMTKRYEPYLWRFESVSLVTFKADPKLELPYIDAYAKASFPHVIKDRMSLELKLSYTREDLKYFGLGNASKIPEDVPLSDPRYAYRREHPSIYVRSGTRLLGALTLLLGISYTHNWLTIPNDTLLAMERDHGTPREREELGPSENHGVFELSYGLGWDDRDNPVAPERGQYHTARVDLAPGGTELVPERWARVDLALRFYVPIVRRRVTLAIRVVSDMLFGDPPFYELQRYDDTAAIGGGNGVRGVPGQRYYGKMKVFSNFELRTRLFDFKLFGQKDAFGLAAFTDVGRVWSDWPADPALDGHGLGLKLGIGAGVRVYGGKSFVVRGDIAWSPDARPIGGYLAPGEIF
jgi:outer membrane protein assembly factor BamA